MMEKGLIYFSYDEKAYLDTENASVFLLEVSMRGRSEETKKKILEKLRTYLSNYFDTIIVDADETVDINHPPKYDVYIYETPRFYDNMRTDDLPISFHVPCGEMVYVLNDFRVVKYNHYPCGRVNPFIEDESLNPIFDNYPESLDIRDSDINMIQRTIEQYFIDRYEGYRIFIIDKDQVIPTGIYISDNIVSIVNKKQQISIIELIIRQYNVSMLTEKLKESISRYINIPDIADMINTYVFNYYDEYITEGLLNETISLFANYNQDEIFAIVASRYI